MTELRMLAPAIPWLFVLIAAGVSVWSALRELRALRAQPSDSPRPSVTVIVFVRDRLEVTLRDIERLESKCEGLDVVAVDRSGNDNVSKNRAILRTSALPDAVYHVKRRPSTTAAALKSAYRKSKKGDIIITLESGTASSMHMLDRAVRLAAISGEETMTAVGYQRGLSGVVGLIKGSAARLAIPFTKAKDRIPPMPTGRVMTKKRFLASIRQRSRNDTTRPSTRLRMAIRWVPYILLLVTATILTVAAIDGSGLELFVSLWAAVASLTGIRFLSDNHMSIGQKFDVAACLPFMPLLLILAPMFPSSNHSFSQGE